MIDETFGDTNAEGLRFGLIAGRFNEKVTDRLVEGALECLRSHGATDEDIEVYRVPGAFEIPVAARRLLDQKRFDALIALGALVRGETPHFDYISAQTSLGISAVSTETRIPIGFGVLTCDTMEQAVARVEPGNNKGWEAALAAIEMSRLFQLIQDKD